DVFVEFFQALILGDLLFEALIEAGIFGGDANVASERFEQLHVFAREKIAFAGAAESGHSNSAGLQAPGQIVVQGKGRCWALLVVVEVQSLLRVFKKDVRASIGLIEIEESKIECLAVFENRSLQAMTSGKAVFAGFFREKDCDARDEQRVWQALDDG